MGLFRRKRKDNKEKKDSAFWNHGFSDAENEEERFIEEMEMLDVIMDDDDWDEI